MKSIYLLSFILVLAAANISVDFSRYLTPSRNFFECLSSQENIHKLIVEILNAQGTFNLSFLRFYVISRDANIKDFDAIIRVNDTFTPQDTCLHVAHALPKTFNGTVWLHVDNNKKNFSVWSIPVEKRIPYLENFVKALQNLGLKTGIYSSADAWAAVMGSRGAGSDILKAVPVWYVNEDSSQDFNDFEHEGFGTWKTPTMKNYEGPATICHPLFQVSSLNYYEDSKLIVA